MEICISYRILLERLQNFGQKKERLQNYLNLPFKKKISKVMKDMSCLKKM